MVPNLASGSDVEEISTVLIAIGVGMEMTPGAAGGFPFYLHDVGVLELGKQCYLQRDRAEMCVLYPAIHKDLGFSDKFYYSLRKLSLWRYSYECHYIIRLSF